jgi:hypothetical protein
MRLLSDVPAPAWQSQPQIIEAPAAPADAPPIGLYRGAAVAAFVQLACTLTTITVVFTLGGEPTTAEEYFTVLQQDRLVGLLRMDFASLINVTLYPVIAFGAYAALRRVNALYAALATALVFLGVAMSLATHSAFSVLALSDQYALATTELQRSQLLTAGAAVIATDWWHSTGGLLAGIFMQGGIVLLSWVMLRSTAFGKLTAYAGMISNGLDWLHIGVGLVLPGVAAGLLMIGGLVYLVWFPLLGRDLWRLGRRTNRFL